MEMKNKKNVPNKDCAYVQERERNETYWRFARETFCVKLREINDNAN